MKREYDTLCRLIGPWTDWIQGPGGNISVKNESGDEILLKKSGARVAAPNNWVRCSLAKIRTSLTINQETTDHAVLEGTGKPSIEAFLHSFPARIIVHAHPYPLMNALCSDEPIELPTYNSETVNYFKPGIPLANAMTDVYTPDTSIYFLRNHGVVIMGNTIEDIINKMDEIATTCFSGPHTDVRFAYELFNAYTKMNGQEPILKSCLHLPSSMLDRLFLPFTPDSAVFLHEAPLSFEEPNVSPSKALISYKQRYGHMPSVIYANGICYILGLSEEGCYNVYEILLGYVHIQHSSRFLSETQVCELVNWDKEKLRQSMNQ